MYCTYKYVQSTKILGPLFLGHVNQIVGELWNTEIYVNRSGFEFESLQLLHYQLSPVFLPSQNSTQAQIITDYHGFKRNGNRLPADRALTWR